MENLEKFTMEKNVEIEYKENLTNNSANDKPKEDDEWLENFREILPEMDPYEDETATKLELGTNKHMEEMVMNSRSLLGDFMGDLVEKTAEVRFASGSKYVGTWDSVGMAGVGRYTMPCGPYTPSPFDKKTLEIQRTTYTCESQSSMPHVGACNYGIKLAH